MSPTTVVLVACVILVSVIKSSLSCNGYTFKINGIKNCGSNNIIKMENVDLILDKECNVVPKGCVTITKSFKSAQAHFTFNKPPMPQISGNADVCSNLAAQKNVAQILALFGLPNKCPIQAQRICLDGTKKYNIGRYRNQLGFLLGDMWMKTEVVHDSGTSCIEGNATLHRR